MDNEKLSILGAGFSCVDIVKKDGREELLPGGTAANVLSILSKLGLHTTFLCANYCDELGVWLKESLIRQGVKIVNFTDSHQPAPRIIELLSNNGKHVFKTTCPKCGKSLVKTVLPNQSHVTQSVVDEVRNCNLFYYDRLSEGIKEIAYLNRRGWNFFEPNSCRVYRPFINAAKYANIIKFAEDRVPKSYTDLLLNDLQESAVQLIIISNGESGFRFSIRDETKMLCNWIYVNAAEANSIVDSSGAGDWMTAVFLYRFLGTYPLFVDQLDRKKICSMLESAKQVAAFSCGYLGAQGIFKEKPALKQMETLFGLNLSISDSPPYSISGECQYCKM